MNTNELKTLLADLNEQLDEVDAKLDKYLKNNDQESREIMEDVWHSINNRIEDVEERIARKKMRKINNPTEKLMSENID